MLQLALVKSFVSYLEIMHSVRTGLLRNIANKLKRPNYLLIKKNCTSKDIYLLNKTTKRVKD